MKQKHGVLNAMVPSVNVLFLLTPNRKIIKSNLITKFGFPFVQNFDTPGPSAEFHYPKIAIKVGFL